MTVARLLGVVPLKMFGSGLATDFSAYGTQYSSFSLDAQSDDPMLFNSMPITGYGVMSQFSSEVLAVGGLSSMVFNPLAQPVGGAHQKYLDGTIWAVGVGPPSSGAPAIYYRDQPNAPGNWPSQPISFNPISNLIMPPPARIDGDFGPINWQGEKLIGFWCTSTGFPGNTLKLLGFNKGGTSILGSIDSAALVAVLFNTNILFSRINTPGPYDNCMWSSIGLANPTPTRTLFNSGNLNGSMFIDPMAMDNAALNAVFQVANSVNSSAFYNGFIFPLVVNGAGVTGQYCEVCVFTPDMSGYYILQLTPQDAVAAQQLSRTSGVPSVKMDSQGIFWFNSGHALDHNAALFSFSSGYQFPVYYFGNLNPITLPCFVDTMAQGLYA